MWGDDGVSAHLIDVKTQGGVVTLTGTVENILAKEKATDITECIIGVRSIVNRVNVAPGDMPDSELRRKVKDALLRDPAADAYELDVTVTDGVVTLTGTVDSWQERQLSAAVAKGVDGVRDLRNKITVDHKMDRSDYEILTEIRARLANDVRVDDAMIKVEVNNGNVKLDGAVGSLAEKRRARIDSSVAGVGDVDDTGLEIKWWARDEMRRKTDYISRTDEKIKAAVDAAFLYDPRVLSFGPKVEVKGGTVTLTGTVDNLRAKQAAQQDAENTLGVWRVENHLRVRPETVLANHELERKIRDAFQQDPYLKRWDVDVSAYTGRVYLSGHVNNSFERDRAEFVAEGINGVVDIENTITFDHVWRWKPDWEIKQDVESELYWTPFVDSDDVKVSVEGGVVTLTGEVTTWSERRSAVENAFEAGAKDVVDKLAFTYGPAS
ncbi:MAG: BON domain-containing protein [Phycisphaerae bacterium]|jgi:osmotically-inducible protein OsmY